MDSLSIILFTYICMHLLIIYYSICSFSFCCKFTYFFNIKKTEERFFFKFYLPKIILVTLIWIVSMIVVLWSGFYNLSNPSSLRLSEVPAFQYFEVAFVALLFVYGAYVIYYLLRGFGNLSRFRDKYSNRFKVVISFSLFVILAFTGVTIIQERTRYTNHGFTFLVSHSIIFLYFNFLALLFLPSGTVEPEKVEDLKNTETPNSGIQDEHFEKPKENTEITHVLESEEHEVKQDFSNENKIGEVVEGKKDDELIDMKL